MIVGISRSCLGCLFVVVRYRFILFGRTPGLPSRSGSYMTALIHYLHTRTENISPRLRSVGTCWPPSSFVVGWCWWRGLPRGLCFGWSVWSLCGGCFPAFLLVASRGCFGSSVVRPPFAGWLSVLARLRSSVGSFVVRPSLLVRWSAGRFVCRPSTPPQLNLSNPSTLKYSNWAKSLHHPPGGAGPKTTGYQP